MEPVHLPTIKIKNDKKKETKIIDLYQINLISLRVSIIFNLSKVKSYRIISIFFFFLENNKYIVVEKYEIKKN